MQTKQTSNNIRNTVKYCVKTACLNGKIHNGSEKAKKTSLRATGFGSLMNIREKINLETSEHAFLGKPDFSDTVEKRW